MKSLGGKTEEVKIAATGSVAAPAASTTVTAAATETAAPMSDDEGEHLYQGPSLLVVLYGLKLIMFYFS